jgi:hypothetical protein
MPSGTATESTFRLHNSSDPLNTGALQLDLTGTSASIGGVAFGTGAGPSMLALSGLGLQLGATDTALSRTAAGVIAAGNGTAGNSSGTFEARKLQVDGSTSGNTIIQSAAAASGTLTLPAATDTLVGRATTDTLTNKTLGGTTPINRLRANQGTPVTAADWVITGLGVGSWGSTASIVSVNGTDTAGSIVISCSGTGQAGNAGFRLTFHDGAFASPPTVIVSRGDGNGPAVPAAMYNVSTTFVTFGFNGVCVAGTNYAFTYLIIGQ